MIVKLLVIQGRPVGKTLTFPRGDFYFGRGAECHVRPNSDWVSRQHCMLRVTTQAVTLRDLGSRNGTLVNGVLLERECSLHHGDKVQIGPLVFEVRLEETSPISRPTAIPSVHPQVADVEHAEAPNAPPSLDSTEHLPVLGPKQRGTQPITNHD